MVVILIVFLYLFLVSMFLLFFRCSNYYGREVCTYLKEMRVREDILLKKISELNKSSLKYMKSNSFVASYNRFFLLKEYLMDDRKLEQLNLDDESLNAVINKIRPGLQEDISILNYIHCTVFLGVVCLGIVVGLFLR